MKKTLLLIVAIFSTVCAMAQGELKVTFPMDEQQSVSAYQTKWTGKDVNGGTWTFVNFNNNSNKWTLIKCGWKTDATTSEITSCVIAEAVTEYTIQVGQTSAVTSCKLEVMDGTSVIESKNVTLEAGTVSVPLSGTANASYHLVIENEKTTANGTTTIESLTLKLAASADAAMRPSLSDAGVFTTKPYEVTITNNESAATVYYTTDGTTPTTSSQSFTGASKTIQINETTTVMAMAAVEGKQNSAVVSATYTYEAPLANTLETAYTTAEAIALIDANSPQLATTQIYVKGTVSKVDSYNATYGSITYWLDNDAFEIYGGLNDKGEKFASQDDIRVGSKVVCLGIVKKYNSTYEMDKNGWLVSYEAPSKPEPTLTAEVKKTLFVGETDSFSPTFNGDAAEFKCTSSDPSVATIAWNDEDLEFVVSALKMGKTTITISVDETENYMPKTFTYTLTVNEKWEAATLPFAFDGGASQATPAKGIMATGLSSDYKASPLMKFDGTGDNLIIKFDGQAKNVIFTIKGNSFKAASQFDVEESADGETFTNLKTYTDEFDETNECLPLKADTRFVRFIYTKKDAGNVALGAIEIGNMEMMADFENETLEAETAKQYATADGTVAFTADSRYTFLNQCAYGATYWAGFTLTNKTTHTANADYNNPYESACGGAKSGKNYLVWYDTAFTGGDSISAPVAREISGFYVTNTTYTENVILNGNFAARALTEEGDSLTLKITGYDVNGKPGKTINYNLAMVHEGALYYVKAWRWVDLTPLGKVASIKFVIDGSDTGQWGLNTPTYFCMDDFGGAAPELDADYEVIDDVTAIKGVATDNGQLTTDNRIYNLAGQRIQKAQKGVNIVGGKKIVF